MAQCYVREERLPQAHAGHTVNPSTQRYWLTEVPPECCSNINSGVTPHCLYNELQIQTLQSSSCMFSDSFPNENFLQVWPWWGGPAAITACVCLAQAQSASRVGFIPLWQSRGSMYYCFAFFSLCSIFFSSLNLNTHKAWAIRHTLLGVSALSLPGGISAQTAPRRKICLEITQSSDSSFCFCQFSSIKAACLRGRSDIQYSHFPRFRLKSKLREGVCVCVCVMGGYNA